MRKPIFLHSVKWGQLRALIEFASFAMTDLNLLQVSMKTKARMSTQTMRGVKCQVKRACIMLRQLHNEVNEVHTD